jgi:hypothetical protein
VIGLTGGHPPAPRFPLCDLRDLCAMLSPNCPDARPEALDVHQKLSVAIPKFPLCDLHDLCAMLSPNCRDSRPEALDVHQKLSAAIPKFPLCDLRDLCAMLSPNCPDLAQKPLMFTKSYPPPSPNSPSVTSVTSVRCFPRIALMLAQKPWRSPKAIRHYPDFPLCDLCISPRYLTCPLSALLLRSNFPCRSESPVPA